MRRIIGKAARIIGRTAGLVGDVIELVFEICDTLDGAKKNANKKARIRKIKKIKK